MRLTEKKLLDNYTGITNSGNNISTINGVVYHWNYGNAIDGYFYHKVYREESNEIKVTNYGYDAKVIPVGRRCMNRLAYNKIVKTTEKWISENCN